MLRAALHLRDLTDPDHGPHAVQHLEAEIVRAGAVLDESTVCRIRHNPPVSVAANYDALGYGAADATRDLESVELVSVTSYDDLPEGARGRLRLRPGQVNALVRLTLRAVDRTLTATEANGLRDAVYLAIHEGRWRS